MSNTKKYVSLDKLGLYDDKIKKFLADADTVALDSAKAYADGLAKNYEAAGTVATAQAALQKNIDVAQAAADAAAAAAATAQGEVDALEVLVGTLPEGSAATSVVDYVNIKTAGIATDAALGELNNQVTGLQNVVNGITADYLKAADKQELVDAIAAEADRADKAEKANAAAIKAITDDYLKAADKEELQGNIDEVAEDVADIVKDYLTSADKTELEGKIDAKADKTALDAEVERATGVEAGFETRIKAIEDDHLVAADKEELQGNIDTLTGVVETLRDGIDAEKVDGVKDLITYVEEHGTEVTGIKEDIADNAEAIEGVAGRMDTAEGKITALEGAVATKVEQTVYDAKVAELAGADTAIKGRLDVLEAIDHDAYVAADTALKNELNGEIAKKADQTALESAVDALEAADEGIIARVAAVEALMGDGEGSVTDQIADAVAQLQGEMATAIDEAKADASNKDAVVLAEAQKAATAVQTALDTHANTADIHVTAADKAKWNAAADVTAKAHEHNNFELLEAITAAKVAAWDGAEAAAKTYADGLNTAMDTRVTAIETWHANFVEVSEQEINDLFAVKA